MRRRDWPARDARSVTAREAKHKKPTRLTISDWFDQYQACQSHTLRLIAQRNVTLNPTFSLESVKPFTNHSRAEKVPSVLRLNQKTFMNETSGASSHWFASKELKITQLSLFLRHQQRQSSEKDKRRTSRAAFLPWVMIDQINFGFAFIEWLSKRSMKSFFKVNPEAVLDPEAWMRSDAMRRTFALEWIRKSVDRPWQADKPLIHWFTAPRRAPWSRWMDQKLAVSSKFHGAWRSL